MVKEWGDEIIFLRKISPGPADRSYGIQVARLAGLPDEVITRAKDVLTKFEEEITHAGKTRSLLGDFPVHGQMDLFLAGLDPLLVDIIKLDISRMTPKTALAKLRELKDRAEAQASVSRKE
jgi:DNA mismatch repair protein MutS